MPRRLWKSVYVDNEYDAQRLDGILEAARQTVSSVDMDETWDEVKEDDLEAVECPVCQHMNDWDLKNCTKCGANLRIETEGDSPS